MADTTSSQPQQTPPSTPFAPPFAIPGFADAAEAWRKLGAEHVERMNAAMAEMSGLEAKALEQARTAVDEMARLAHASLTWAHETSQAMRKIALEAAQRTTPKA